MDKRLIANARAVRRLVVVGFIGALLSVFGMAPGAHAATVSHFRISNAAVVEATPARPI